MTETITLAHGNGGVKMRQLIEATFAKYFRPLGLNDQSDSASLSLPSNQCLMTTDSFTVQPLEFPGGNIGSLAIHGTVNDLAVSGAKTVYMSVNAIIEEGFPVSKLEQIVASMAQTAENCDVQVVTGDTKVVRKNECAGLYLVTTGIGVRVTESSLDSKHIQEGDCILVSGPVGDHGTAVLLAREEFGLQSNLISDAATVFPLMDAIKHLSGLRCLRDPTRGGLNMVAQDWVQDSGLGVQLDQKNIPVSDEVQAVCSMLGYDPYNLACEGRIVLAVSPEQVDEVLSIWEKMPNGDKASVVGYFTKDHQQVRMTTFIGGERWLPPLEDDPLPRIC